MWLMGESPVRTGTSHLPYELVNQIRLVDYPLIIVKDDFYAHVAAGNPSMAQTTSKAEHAQKRKNLAHVFSAKEIKAMEPRVMAIAKKLCRDLRIKSNCKQIKSPDEYVVVD